MDLLYDGVQTKKKKKIKKNNSNAAGYDFTSISPFDTFLNLLITMKNVRRHLS